MSNIHNNHSPVIDDLFRAILLLQDIDECYRFFGDLFTVQELTTFSQRLQIARLLSDGKTYGAIRKEVATSTSTITRINTELCYGGGGYQMVLERLARLKGPEADGPDAE